MTKPQDKKPCFKSDGTLETGTRIISVLEGTGGVNISGIRNPYEGSFVYIDNNGIIEVFHKKPHGYHLADLEDYEKPVGEKPAIEGFIDALEKSGAKLTFGLTESNLKVIQKHLALFDGALYDHWIWKDIGKEIGWEPLSAALYYFKHLNKQS